MAEDRYKVIAFDLGNTLIRFDHNIAARKIANLFHLDLKRIYDTIFDSPITREFEKGEISTKEFHIKMSKYLGMKIPYRDFVSIWNEIFWKDEGSCALALKLKKHYKLFLISNVNRLHFEYIEKKFGIMGMFDELILSYLVGAMKPDRKIFDEVVRRAGGDRRAVIYIDDREDLIKEATALGIDSIRYENAEKLEDALRARGIKINS